MQIRPYNHKKLTITVSNQVRSMCDLAVGAGTRIRTLGIFFGKVSLFSVIERRRPKGQLIGQQFSMPVLCHVPSTQHKFRTLVTLYDWVCLILKLIAGFTQIKTVRRL